MRRAGAGDLKAVVLAAMQLDEPDVVEHRADVEQFGVIARPRSAPCRASHGYTRSEWRYGRSDSTLRNHVGCVTRDPAVGHRVNGRGSEGAHALGSFRRCLLSL